MPTGDTYTTGANIAARQTAAGFVGAASNDFRCTPTAQTSCTSGANISQLESDLGLTSNIYSSVSSNSVKFSYTAPDSDVCHVDISTNSFATITRLADSGGDRNRTVTFSSLPASTAHSYRILCHADQTEGANLGWFSFPSDPSNLQTNGTFTTLANTATSPQFTFSPSLISSFSTFRVTLTPLSGSDIVTSCTTSPCTVGPIAVGDYSMKQEWLSSGVVKLSGTTPSVSIR
jgi:hypothetical protein